MMRPWLLVPCLLATAPVRAALSEQDLARAIARPAAGVSLPDPVLTDMAGHRAGLRSFAQARPLVLIFADFTCRNICSPGLTITAARLRETGLVPGRDYRLAVVGIDPRDTLADARHFVAAIHEMPEVAGVTSVLRGDAVAVRDATRALGYGYVYDPDIDQFAHDASIYVFDASGRLVTNLPEIGLLAPPLKAALTQSGDSRSADWISQVAHVCYGFAAAHGRFSRLIVPGLQALSLLLLAVAGALLWRRKAAA